MLDKFHQILPLKILHHLSDLLADGIAEFLKALMRRKTLVSSLRSYGPTSEGGSGVVPLKAGMRGKPHVGFARSHGPTSEGVSEFFALRLLEVALLVVALLEAYILGMPLALNFLRPRSPTSERYGDFLAPSSVRRYARRPRKTSPRSLGSTNEGGSDVFASRLLKVTLLSERIPPLVADLAR
mmetsp:Transcript_620/g.1584  ORF Transcript_620/g.1584 Transcript_620/m.1584 type:complete len:183 (-) Transcript_620:536-1084(-)